MWGEWSAWTPDQNGELTRSRYPKSFEADNTDNVVGDGHEEASKEEASKEEDSEEEESEEDSEEEDSSEEDSSKEESSEEDSSEEDSSEEDSSEEDSSEEDSSEEDSSEEDSSEEESSEEDNSEEDGNEEDSSESQEDVPVVVVTKMKPVWTHVVNNAPARPRARPNPRPKKLKPVDALLTKIKNLEKAKLAKIDKFLGPFFKKFQTVL